ncbi:hypothetical protein MGL_2236 [Malassezia globosa CBS 7966]|uniref:RING-type E3 ubiquitin transferase n=1 Tax=Malassezia globosa (strain ATCC MYA-4612 / CBS 7966) TaxID=425265 RepID=A8Q2U3_MALGO|nr:uncharacterized protein MGL_2236 [Malassezia globosa CBS 7966]EDP43226.1 hypothetical protein MGL_2236 [Malassezia globosa CBS 7966]
MNDALLDEVSDPSDWTGAWSELRPLDTSLRCGLCYKKAFDAELVAQPALEAAANHWRHARRLRPRKRAAVDDLDGEHVDYRALDASTLVQCPICQHEFDAATLNEHLDRGCGLDDPHPASSSALSSTASSKMDSWLRRPSMTHQPSPKRLTRPQYQLKSEKDLRKMLEALELPASGTKDRLIDRHRHWVNLYNANLDAAPALRASIPSLRKQLRQWERAQDESLCSKTITTEKQAQSWLKANQDTYASLAAQARATLHASETKYSADPSTGGQDSNIPGHS